MSLKSPPSMRLMGEPSITTPPPPPHLLPHFAASRGDVGRSLVVAGEGGDGVPHGGGSRVALVEEVLCCSVCAMHNNGG